VFCLLQGLALCAARDRQPSVAGLVIDPSLEPLLPGFLSAKRGDGAASSSRLSGCRGKRAHGADHGESGTWQGARWRARFTSGRIAAPDLPALQLHDDRTRSGDSQLFGHRRGSFTGARLDQPGLVRTAAGGTLFLDEIRATSPIDVQPKLPAFSRTAGDHADRRDEAAARPMSACWPPRTPTSSSASPEGKFREDLYYRLSVIRDPRAAAPRAARGDPASEHVFSCAKRSTRLGKPDVHLSSEALDVFSHSTGGPATCGSSRTKSSARSR